MARTLFRNPDFLLMDEATSALDKVSERMVTDHLKDFLQGRTVFIITHNHDNYDRLLDETHHLKDLITKSKKPSN